MPPYATPPYGSCLKGIVEDAFVLYQYFASHIFRK